MRKTLQLLGVATLILLTGTVTLAANRGTTFKPIGFIEDPGPFPASLVFGITDDGSKLLTSPSWSGSYCTFTDVDTLEWTLIGSSYDTCQMSADGSTVMGAWTNDNGDEVAAVWTGVVDEWDTIATIPGYEPCGNLLSFYGMGGNADFATGLLWDGCGYARGFKWTGATDTTIDTGTISNNSRPSSRGNAISDDGMMIAGWNVDTCGGWRGAEYTDATGWQWVDGMDAFERKICASDSSACCGDSDCPEYVNHTCDNRDRCVEGVCQGGANNGQACSGYWNCSGYCTGGPSEGQDCTSDYYCENEGVGSCSDNPAHTPDMDLNYKGEAYDISRNGEHILGMNFGNPDWQDPNYDPTLYGSGYIKHADGSFTQLPPPETGSPYDSWTTIAVNNDGTVAVGRYGWWIYSFPVVWTKETGTLDLQWFLVGQGLDELWYWYLYNLTAVSGDGRYIAGYGYNPDNWLEGFVVDLEKLALCHKPGAHNERTLRVSWESIPDHLAHGDVLSTCEFMAGGAHSRARLNSMRPARPEGPPTQTPDLNNGHFSERELKQIRAMISKSVDQPEATDATSTEKAPERRELTKRERLAPERQR